jgi:hypothetical protein
MDNSAGVSLPTFVHAVNRVANGTDVIRSKD